MLLTLSATSEAAESAESTETSATATEDITEHGENVVHGETAAAESAETTHLGTIKAKLVVAFTFLGIMEHIVSLSSLLEFLFSFFLLRF